MSSIPRYSRTSQKGASVILVAVSLLMIAGMTGLAIDVGRGMVARNELQNMADAAALAGAGSVKSFVNQDWDSVDGGCQSARDFILKNRVDGTALQAGDFTITRGLWDTNKRVFEKQVVCPSALTVGSPAVIPIADIENHDLLAIRVEVARKADGTSGPLNTFFMRIFGNTSLSVAADAIAAVGTGSTIPSGRALPLLMSYCSFRYAGGDTGAFNPPGDGDNIVAQTTQSFKEVNCPSPVTSLSQHEYQWSSFQNFNADYDKDDDGLLSQQEMNDDGFKQNEENGAKLVKDMLTGVTPIPELATGGVVYTNVMNGAKHSILESMSSDSSIFKVGSTVFVPIIADAAMNRGNNQPAQILNFMPVKIVGYPTKGQDKGIQFEILEGVPLGNQPPNLSGNRQYGVLTKAFLVE